MQLLIATFVLAVVTASFAPAVMGLDATKLDRCTTIITGKTAGRHGPMVTHTADCLDCDFRAGKVPAADHPVGSTRNVYMYKSDYPAAIMTDRGPTWQPDNIEGTEEQKKAWGTQSQIIMAIPEVKHTYALIEAGYGIMNEHQVAIGESTCAARFWAAPPSAGGKARIEVSAMSRIALERCKSARCAIELMGELAEEYGYYAADWSGGDNSKGEAGEALTVIDREEAWVFHVLSDDTRTSAVWAAQRVQDDHIAVVANSFVIRKIDPALRGKDFLYSDNMHEVAQRNELWEPKKGLLDFLPVFAPMRAHSVYSTRRVWRVFSLAAPSHKLPAHTDGYGNDYPFSLPVDAVLDEKDLMRYNQDHYEGTEFDLTKGIQGGPYGDPARYDVAAVGGMSYKEAISGTYERAISMFRTSYSFVAVARPLKTNLLAMLWFGQYQPSTSSYSPVYVAADLPVQFTKGSLFKYDSSVPFWNYLAANNYASRWYKHTIGDIYSLRDSLLGQAEAAVATFEKTVNDLVDTMRSTEQHRTTAASAGEELAKEVRDTIDTALTATMTVTVLSAMNELCQAHVNTVTAAWRDLLPALITKYHDGYTESVDEHGNIDMEPMFYDLWWLKISGYFLNKPVKGDDVLLFEESPYARGSGSGSGSGSNAVVYLLLTASVGAVAMYAGFNLGQKSATEKTVQTPSDAPEEQPASSAWGLQLQSLGRPGAQRGYVQIDQQA